MQWQPFLGRGQFASLFSKYDAFARTFADLTRVREAVTKMKRYAAQKRAKESFALYSMQEAVVLTHKDILELELNIQFLLNLAQR